MGRAYDRAACIAGPYRFDLSVMPATSSSSARAAAKWDLLNLRGRPGAKGIWQDVIWELIEQRAARAGVMLHLATPELDEGPPVTYCTYPICGPDFDWPWQQIEGPPIGEIKDAEGEDNTLFQEIRRHGIAREIPLVIETLRAFADGHVRIENKHIVDADGRPIPPYDLTEQIEQALRNTKP
jgi:hypothetical protein